METTYTQWSLFLYVPPRIKRQKMVKTQNKETVASLEHLKLITPNQL